jgi:hypothetical protein
VRHETIGSVLPVCAAAGWLVFFPFPAAAQAPVPLGAQFQVNTSTLLDQQLPAVAEASDGRFVVVWESDYEYADHNASIQGQRFGSDGAAQGAQFQVNSSTPGEQERPAVATAADGRFVVAWQSTISVGTDTSFWSVQGQRYASDGSAQGAPFQVNTYTTNTQNDASVAAAADGDFVVVWTSVGSSGTDTSSSSIHGQRYASNGSPQGAEFQVNTFTSGFQNEPFAAASPDGDFVVVWTAAPGSSAGTDTHETSVQGQRYSADGSPQGGQFQVNTYTTGLQQRPAVAADPDGGFLVAWVNDKAFPSDPGVYSIQARRYAPDGSAVSAQFQVNTYSTGRLTTPSVAAAGDGGFVVVWTSSESEYSTIRAQRYAPDGSALGPETQFSLDDDFAVRPSVAAASDRLVAVWSGYPPGGYLTEIVARLFSLPAVMAIPALSAFAGLALAVALFAAAIYATTRRS